MKKCDEIADPTSCWNKAGDDEIVFILLARDRAAPKTIRSWIVERIGLMLNRPDDAQILEADECQRKIEAGHRRS